VEAVPVELLEAVPVSVLGVWDTDDVSVGLCVELGVHTSHCTLGSWDSQDSPVPIIRGTAASVRELPNSSESSSVDRTFRNLE
jgi:hypothetical protein